MILRQLLAIVPLLSITSKVAASFLSELTGSMKQLFIKEDIVVETPEFFDPSYSIKVIEQRDALRTSTLNDNIKVAVKQLECSLSDLLTVGVSSLNIATFIKSLFPDAEKLVLAAIKIQAHALLKNLQNFYIWRDDAQFHWFQTVTFHSPWYDEKMWETFPMNWENNLQAVCVWDNADLALIIQKDIVLGPAQTLFNDKLMLQCSKYDSIRVFKTMQMEPAQLSEYLEIMAAYGSIELLKLYQASIKVERLHLERYPPSKKLPINVEAFVFLTSHGLDCFPIGQIIEECCREGRLDLLVHLHELEPGLLVPNERDLMLAAENGRLDIIKWADKLGLVEEISKKLAFRLAINDQTEALDWLISNSKVIVEKDVIKELFIAGSSKALQWIYEKQPLQYEQEWINLAAEGCHLPVLEWVYEKSNLLPTISSLRNATTGMLDWVKTKDNTLISISLVECGAENLELLQWIYKNDPNSILSANKLTLSLGIHNKDMMKWLYDKLKISPADMNWAYETDDLEAVQWALDNRQILPADENIACAIENGSLDIIKWFHQKYSEHLKMSEALKLKQNYGSKIMADYIVSNFEPGKVLTFDDLGDSTNWDWRLDSLKWIRDSKHVLDKSLLIKEIDLVASSGQLQPFLHFVEAFPEIQPSLNVLDSLASRGYYETYKWFLENCHEESLAPRLGENIQMAFKNGHLEVVKMILDKFPRFIKEISELEVTRLNYHIKRWLTLNDIWKDRPTLVVKAWFKSLIK